MFTSAGRRDRPTHTEEIEELEAILRSSGFSRSNNLTSFLQFICECYFEGRTDDICELNIATRALARREIGFDPQRDPIVRVTARLLRKRLQKYYAREGASHSVRLELPSGHYVPHFVRQRPGSLQEADVPEVPEQLDGAEGFVSAPVVSDETGGTRDSSASSSPAPCLVPGEMPSARDNTNSRERPAHGRLVWLALSVAFGIATFVGSLFLGSRQRRNASAGSIRVPPRTLGEPNALMVPTGKAIRGLLYGGPAYIDHAGRRWTSIAHWCSGGTSFSRPSDNMLGTQDPTLFTTGREGVFHCRIPESPGTYEVHLFFAETKKRRETEGIFRYRLNWLEESIDVVDLAKGPDRATRLVYTDIHPSSDGTIHLDVDDKFGSINSVEILPGISGHIMRPIRYVAASSPYTDHLGHRWLPDQYAFGGTLAKVSYLPAGTPDPGLFASQRFGHFSYNIPVAAVSRTYTLRLYFSESWFGPHRWITGGIGSRVFDVYCNGHTLLHNFDIIRESKLGHEVVVEEFHGIRPSPKNEIELSFEASQNYALVNAIEVDPELGEFVPK